MGHSLVTKHLLIHKFEVMTTDGYVYYLGITRTCCLLQPASFSLLDGGIHWVQLHDQSDDVNKVHFPKVKRY